MRQPSLFTARAPVALPCPGNCLTLRSIQAAALRTAHHTRTAGLRSEGGCSQCGGIALARVVSLGPVVLESRGGIPRRPPWMEWKDYAPWRETLLHRLTFGANWRRRLAFRPGWRAVGSRR